MSETVLTVEDLRVRFLTDEGTVHAVNSVSFEVFQGETLGVVGESGCGKSVSMLSVLRLLPEPPAKISGHIRFRDRDVIALSQAEIRGIRGSQIAMIFQDPMTSLNPVLTIERQMTEPLETHRGLSRRAARARAVELLDMVGIPEAEERLDDYPHQFSGGMRQRVMIAMALTCDPALLIADEPTTALDVTIQAQIVNLVKRLRDQLGMSLIWITHDLGVIAGLVDRVNVMYAGRIVESAHVEDLYAQPLHPYTVGLLQSLPRMDRRSDKQLDQIPGLPPSLTFLHPGCSFAPRCPFVQDVCRQKQPPLLELSAGHEAACWIDMETGNVREHSQVQS
jgi:oligopeptide transport system ATP-binding protein